MLAAGPGPEQVDLSEKATEGLFELRLTLRPPSTGAGLPASSRVLTELDVQAPISAVWAGTSRLIGGPGSTSSVSGSATASARSKYSVFCFVAVTSRTQAVAVPFAASGTELTGEVQPAAP